MPSQTNCHGDSFQLSKRAWLDNFLPWLPTSNASYASLIEHGYTLTPQGRVVVYSYQHAQAVFFNLYTRYTIYAPSPIAPTFTFTTALAGRRLRWANHALDAFWRGADRRSSGQCSTRFKCPCPHCRRESSFHPQ
eukprot:6173692-Pleurochrysis_carterae.AAC.6